MMLLLGEFRENELSLCYSCWLRLLLPTPHASLSTCCKESFHNHIFGH